MLPVLVQSDRLQFFSSQLHDETNKIELNKCARLLVDLQFDVSSFSAAAPPSAAVQASQQRLHGSTEAPPLLSFLSQEGGAAVHQEVSICSYFEVCCIFL